MKKIGSKINIQQIQSFNSEILINELSYKNLWVFRRANFIKVFYDDFYFGREFGEEFYFLKRNGGDIFTLNKMLHTEKKLDGIWYLASCEPQSLTNYLKLRGQIGSMTSDYLLDLKDNLSQTRFLFDLEFEDRFIFKGFSQTQIEAYSKTDETLLWQINTSLYGFFKETIDDGFTEHPNTIDRPIFGNDNCVYVPMKGGQLLALNALDGSLKWMLEMPYSGFYGIYEDRIYKNSDNILYEIDAKSGSILRSLEYKHLKKLKGLFGFSADFRVYEDYIVLKDQIRGWVAMFDRKTMTLAHLAETGSRIGSDASYFHWIDNKLYVLDRENTLHIFEI